MNGIGKITFGGKSNLRNVIYEGEFIENECFDGDLYIDEKNSIKGTLHVQLGKESTGKETKIKFYTLDEIEKGMDKFFIIYQDASDDRVGFKKFKKYGEAIGFYQQANMTIGGDILAKVIIRDREILRKAGP